MAVNFIVLLNAAPRLMAHGLTQNDVLCRMRRHMSMARHHVHKFAVHAVKIFKAKPCSRQGRGMPQHVHTGDASLSLSLLKTFFISWCLPPLQSPSFSINTLLAQDALIAEHTMIKESR
ncbi:hypothetical protein COO60DRAFT_591213 [Scenedesmus sp. NREL 46B-D3]|nr:hypothetical protein COO60DRAFT_591213 [Scenedesmus sp. NREL 46B-D3]